MLLRYIIYFYARKWLDVVTFLSKKPAFEYQAVIVLYLLHFATLHNFQNFLCVISLHSELN
jgi:hypothetical protein